ncbi:MAG: hypothetical protein F4Z96_01890 [Chloroflexi bacterium]|nr:hypothetical protein [Chloroflexota bacterium]
MDATALFEDAIEWLREHYSEFRFFTERDLVWTVQRQLLEQIEDGKLALRVFNEERIGGKRADLTLVEGDTVVLAAEFKYEPSRERDDRRGGDIRHTKFPVVDWREAAADVGRAREFAEQRHAHAGYSIFVDEGGAFRHRTAPTGSRWSEWGGGVSVLWSRWREAQA